MMPFSQLTLQLINFQYESIRTEMYVCVLRKSGGGVETIPMAVPRVSCVSKLERKPPAALPPIRDSIIIRKVAG